MNLTKPNKKVARELIEKGLNKDFEKQLKKYDRILSSWKSGKLTAKEAYQKMTPVTQKSIQYIDNRYSDVTGSRYYMTVLGLWMDKLIDDEDIEQFSDDVKLKLKAQKEYFEKD